MKKRMRVLRSPLPGVRGSIKAPASFTVTSLHTATGKSSACPSSLRLRIMTCSSLRLSRDWGNILWPGNWGLWPPWVLILIYITITILCCTVSRVLYIRSCYLVTICWNCLSTVWWYCVALVQYIVFAVYGVGRTVEHRHIYNCKETET